MREQRIAVAKDTLHSYLEHLVDARLIYTVNIRRASYRARMTSPRKAYAVDPGLAISVAHPSEQGTGPLLENAVYLELRRRHGRLSTDVASYLFGKAGGVDFVVDADGAPPRIIHASASHTTSSTREREVRGAVVAMSELGVRKSTIVTLYERDTIETDAGTIHVEPAWRWMLGSRSEQGALE